MSYALWTVSYSFTTFVFARMLGGLSKGNVSLSLAVITDVSTPATRTAGMVSVNLSQCESVPYLQQGMEHSFPIEIDTLVFSNFFSFIFNSFHKKVSHINFLTN